MVGVFLAAAFAITSAAFTDGGNIPSKFTCDAGQTSPSPALVWKDAPAGTKSFTLVMDDPDVTQVPGGFVHWVLIDIPAKTMELPEGFQVGSLGVSGNTGMRRPGYMGPCPPTGAHHYHFNCTRSMSRRSAFRRARHALMSRRRWRSTSRSRWPRRSGSIRNSLSKV
jgi:Raf kinase inhibitor-like YbhB/YbcL family protein